MFAKLVLRALENVMVTVMEPPAVMLQFRAQHGLTIDTIVVAFPYIDANRCKASVALIAALLPQCG